MRFFLYCSFICCSLFAFASCSTAWEDNHEQAFVDNCLSNIEEGVEYDAEAYCTCMLEQVKAASPNVFEVKQIPNVDLESMAKACLNVD